MILPREIVRAIEALPLNEQEAIAEWLHEKTSFGAPTYAVREAAATYGVPAPQSPTPQSLSVEEYFELEKRMNVRHEYINGAVYAMVGVSLAHNQVSLALATRLTLHVRGGPCRVFSEAVKLRLELGDDRLYYYPDVMVACDKKGWDDYYIHNPKLVIEVLSPSTQSTDLREKAMSYKRLPSVEEYAVFAQKECRATVYRRAEGWERRIYAGPEAMLELRSVGFTAPLDELYRTALGHG